MISDALYDVVTEIDRYLADPVIGPVYEGGIRERIVALRHEADAIRVRLDTPPERTEPTC